MFQFSIPAITAGTISFGVEFSTQNTIASSGSDISASGFFLISLHLLIRAKFAKFSYEVKSVDLFTKYPILWSFTLGSNLSSGILIKICLAVTDKYLGSVTAETLYALGLGAWFSYANVTSKAVLVSLLKTFFTNVFDSFGLP